MTPADELRDLFQRVTEMVLANVDRYGYAIPVCVTYDRNGERVIFVADSLDETTADVPYDPAAAVRSIAHQVREWIGQGKLRSVALARNVTITMSTADGSGTTTTSAVKVLLDHEAGSGSAAYLTYSKGEDGAAVPGELFHEPLPERFFTAAS